MTVSALSEQRTTRLTALAANASIDVHCAYVGITVGGAHPLRQEMDASEVGSILRHPAAGSVVLGCVAAFPTLHLEADASPITRQVLRVVLRIKPTFNWRVR